MVKLAHATSLFLVGLASAGGAAAFVGSGRRFSRTLMLKAGECSHALRKFAPGLLRMYRPIALTFTHERSLPRAWRDRREAPRNGVGGCHVSQVSRYQREPCDEGSALGVRQRDGGSDLQLQSPLRRIRRILGHNEVPSGGVQG